MANELTLRVSASFEKDSLIFELLYGPKGRDVAGANGGVHRQNIGTAEEAVVLTDIAPGGYFMGINRDPTNYIELRPGSGLDDLIRLLPGDVCLFRLTNDATLYAIAHTAECALDYFGVDL